MRADRSHDLHPPVEFRPDRRFPLRRRAIRDRCASPGAARRFGRGTARRRAAWRGGGPHARRPVSRGAGRCERGRLRTIYPRSPSRPVRSAVVPSAVTLAHRDCSVSAQVYAAPLSLTEQEAGPFQELVRRAYVPILSRRARSASSSWRSASTSPGAPSRDCDGASSRLCLHPPCSQPPCISAKGENILSADW